MRQRRQQAFDGADRQAQQSLGGTFPAVGCCRMRNFLRPMCVFYISEAYSIPSTGSHIQCLQLRAQKDLVSLCPNSSSESFRGVTWVSSWVWHFRASSESFQELSQIGFPFNVPKGWRSRLFPLWMDCSWNMPQLGGFKAIKFAIRMFDMRNLGDFWPTSQRIKVCASRANGNCKDWFRVSESDILWLSWGASHVPIRPEVQILWQISRSCCLSCLSMTNLFGLRNDVPTSAAVRKAWGKWHCKV